MEPVACLVDHLEDQNPGQRSRYVCYLPVNAELHNIIAGVRSFYIIVAIGTTYSNKNRCALLQ